jgi:crotonobetaine/carnitine-CoA ligase
VSLAHWFDGLVGEGISERPLAFFQNGHVTYGEIRSRAWALGSALQRLGATGERVATMLPNDPELLALQFAILHAGAVTVPVIAEGTPDEMRHFVEDSQASIVIATRERWEAIAPLVHNGPHTVILTDPAGGAGEPAAGGPRIEELAALEADGAALGLDPVAVPDSEPMALMYTSGSTARPKGVVVDAASFVKDAELQPELFGFGEGDTALGVLSLYHIAGWHQSLAIALGCRGALMMQARFSASRFWPDVDRSNAVGGLLMPAMMSILLARPEQEDDRDHPLRVVLSHWVEPRLEERFGVEIVPVWGQTELGGLAVSGRAGDSDRPSGCVGTPLPETDVEIRDETGQPLAVGSVGEICVRSPWVMKGYWGDPDLSAGVMQDGWVRTGDLGYVDERGRLFFTGRQKAMIKRGGENVSALEVEKAIAEHPDVAECVCFGVPDPIRTEEVKVVVVGRQGAKLDFPALVEFSRKRLAEFKIPRYWQAAADLPRTRSMKVATQALRDGHGDDPGWDRTRTPAEASR